MVRHLKTVVGEVHTRVVEVVNQVNERLPDGLHVAHYHQCPRFSVVVGSRHEAFRVESVHQLGDVAARGFRKPIQAGRARFPTLAEKVEEVIEEGLRKARENK